MCAHENTKHINKSKKVAIKILAETLIILLKINPLVYNQELEKVGEVQNVLNHLSIGWLRKETF